MEDVRCPGCGGMIPFPEGNAPACPRCGRGIDLVEGGGGMWIVGLRQPPPRPLPATPYDDPLVRTYGKWKGIGFFILLLGLVCGALLLIDLVHAYRRIGFYFGQDQYILAGAGILLFLAGGVLFLAGWALKYERLRRLNLP